MESMNAKVASQSMRESVGVSWQFLIPSRVLAQHKAIKNKNDKQVDTTSDLLVLKFPLMT